MTPSRDGVKSLLSLADLLVCRQGTNEPKTGTLWRGGGIFSHDELYLEMKSIICSVIALEMLSDSKNRPM